MKPFLEFLQTKTVLFDGAMGTQLIAAGMTRGDCSERWNLDRTAVVAAIHRAYAEAGADVATTNTFGATKGNLGRHALAEKLRETVLAAVAAARSGANESIYVAGDLGPTGELLPPMGKATASLYKAWFSEQAEALATGGVDLFLVETQYDLREALEAVRAIQAVSSLPIGVTMTFNRTRRGYFTMIGDSVERCCGELEQAGAGFIGANCTLAPPDMLPLSEQLLRHSSLPVLVQPNAGQPETNNVGIEYRFTPEQFAETVRELLKLGVRAVGGCCGTTPDHIRALRKIIDAEQR